MKKIAISLLFILASNCLFCQLGNESLSDTDKEFLGFFKVFKETIRNKDKDKMSELIHFPFLNDYFKCDAIYKNKYQFINNISNIEYEIFTKNDIMLYLQDYLKYFDKIVNFDEQLVLKKNNPFTRIWVKIHKNEIDDNIKQEACWPESDYNFYYMIAVTFGDEDGESGKYLTFLKINNKFKLVSFHIAG